ncbi:MAG: glycosyltransferase family 2 protein [Acidobacteria bacterium]|nr:glycosyltransferase family 2 protein [Acidobacteriota bacterium]
MVSIIMPVRNEALFIGRSLGALLRQTYPGELMEVIVADGMSTDSTRETIKELAGNSEIPIFIVENPKLIAPTGLNRALQKASGDIVIRVDGHCEVDSRFVENCVVLLQSGAADGVGGPIETVGDSRRANAIALAMSSTFGVGGSAFRTIDDREIYTDTVAFPGYTREILVRAGAFNEELVRNQDDEYNYRIRKLGGRILLSPSIRSRYYSRSSFKSLLRQYFEYGYWKVRILQLHPGQMSFRQFVPFIFVVTLILLSLLATFSVTGRWGLLLLAGSYLLTNFAAALYTARSKVSTVPLLSLSYLILHISYGFGSLVGLISFRSRWGHGVEKVESVQTICSEK